MKTVRLVAVLVAAVFVAAILLGGCGKSGATGQQTGDVGAAKPASDAAKAEMAKKMGGFVSKSGQPGGGPPPEMKGGAAAPAKTQ